MNIDVQDIYGPEMEVNYNDRLCSKFANFNDEFLSSRLTSEAVIQKLMKDKYAPHLQKFAQMLWNIKEYAPKLLSVFPEIRMVRPFITGLLHNETMLKPLYKHAEDIDIITEIVQKALDISNENLKPALKQELISLEEYKHQLTAKFQDIKGASIELELDYKSYLEKVKDRPKISLKWENIMALNSSKIGLRHLSSLERGNREFNEGCYGDAISIQNGVVGNICKLLVERKITFSWIPPDDFFDQGYFDDKVNYVSNLLNFREIISSLSQEDKRKVIEQYEDSLWNWLYFSIFCFDNQIDLLSPKEGFISRRISSLSTTSTFLIVGGCDSNGQDFISYNYFGKCGKGYINSERMKIIISIPQQELENACALSEDKSIQGLLTAIDRAALLTVYKQVLQAIHQP